MGAKRKLLIPRSSLIERATNYKNIKLSESYCIFSSNLLSLYAEGMIPLILYSEEEKS